MAFTFLVGDSDFSGAAVPGVSVFVTQLSATAMLGSREREREREREITEAQQRRTTAIHAETRNKVPHLFLIHSSETK